MLETRNKSIRTVAIALNTSWNIYNFRLALIRELRDQGYRVVIIAPRDEYTQKIEEEGFTCYDIKMNNKGVNPLEDLFLIRSYYKLYKKIRPHVVLNYTIKPNIYSSLATKKLDIPTINNITGLGTVFLNNNFSSHIARLLYKISLHKNAVVFQNKEDMKLFLEKKLVNQPAVTLIPGSGIDMEKFKSITQEKKDSKFVFLMIARLIKDKGFEEYIDAIRMIRASSYGEKCTFKILGSLYLSNPTAIDKETLDGWIEEGIIEYLGHSDNVQEEIEKVDCVVLPSYREGLSRVLLEASSMKKPIITTNVPGCRDVVDDGVTGYLVETKSSSQLANAMKKMLNLSVDELNMMGNKGREKVETHFSEQKIIAKYLSLFYRLGIEGKGQITQNKYVRRNNSSVSVVHNHFDLSKEQLSQNSI